MAIWVDADACPAAIRDILIRVAGRKQISITFVANHAIPLPKLNNIHFVQVPKGFDVADHHIATQISGNDIVVTQDIPLAAEVVAKGCVAINPRGELYTEHTIRSRLSMRNFMEELRSSGVETGGPTAFGNREKQAFANTLDTLLAKQ